MSWIQWTTESDPEWHVYVLVWTRWNQLLVASRDWSQGGNPEHWSTPSNGRLELSDVTHWMTITPPTTATH